MKLVLDERDKKFESRVNSGEFPRNHLLYNKTDKEYSINFKIKDLAKANNFLFTLINFSGDPSEETKQLIEATGIDVTVINYYPAISSQNVDSIKAQLQAIIDSL